MSLWFSEKESNYSTRKLLLVYLFVLLYCLSAAKLDKNSFSAKFICKFIQSITLKATTVAKVSIKVSISLCHLAEKA